MTPFIQKFYRLVLSSFLLSLLIKPLAYCVDDKAGTSGAPFLKIGAGARPTAMGNSFVGIADDVNASYFNPAGLASLKKPEMTAMHTQWFQGLNYDFGAFVYPTERSAWAISAATLKADDLEKRGLDEGAQGTFDNLDSAYAVSYAKNVRETISIGVTGRLIRQKIDTASANTLSADIGVLKQMESHPLSWGLAIRHLGPEIQFRDEGDPQPLTIDVGMGSRLFSDKMLLGLNVFKPRDNGVKFGIGTEWKQTIIEERVRYALRAGYNSLGTDADGTDGISLGAGLGFKRLDLDFAWVPFGDLGNTFRYAALFRF